MRAVREWLNANAAGHYLEYDPATDAWRTLAPMKQGLGSVGVAVCMLAVPMWVFGKKIRSFYHRNDIWKILHLEVYED